MRSLNKFIIKKSFRMDTTKDVRQTLEPHMWGAVIDLSDAYYHISTHQKSRKYTRFLMDGQVFEFLGLPMGLTCSPRVFTRVTKSIVSWLRRQGVTLVIYLDVSSWSHYL